jgi:hypothetical protein
LQQEHRWSSCTARFCQHESLTHQLLLLLLSPSCLQKDKSCPFVIKSAEINSSYTVEWPIPKNMTKAAWYATVLVQCENGTLNSYCQVRLINVAAAAAAAAAAAKRVVSN